MKDSSSNIKKWTALVRKIWDDPTLKEVVLADPHKFLSDNGFETKKSQTIEIHENTPNTLHLILPEKPSRDIPDETLNHIVAGY